MESLSRKSKIGASVTNSRNQSNSNLYTSGQSGVVEGYHVPSSVLLSQGHQLYPAPGREGAHLHQYEELKVLIPEYGSRKALIYSNGHGNSNHPPSLQHQLSSQRRNDADQISSSLHPGSSFFYFLLFSLLLLSFSLVLFFSHRDSLSFRFHQFLLR